MNIKSKYEGAEVFEGLKHAKLIKLGTGLSFIHFIDKTGRLVKQNLMNGQVIVDTSSAQYFLDGAFQMYEHIDERLTTGNIVKIVNNDGNMSSELRKGDIVKITKDDRSLSPYRVQVLKGNKVGYEGVIFPWNLEKLSNEEMKEFERAEIGDYVVVTDTFNGILNTGDVAQVREVTIDGYFTTKMNGKTGGYKDKNNVRKATEEEIKKAKRCAFEVGDVVIILQGINGHAKVGEVVKIKEKATSHRLAQAESIIDGKYKGAKKAENIRLATKEEIEEYKKKHVDEKLRAKWKKIGREIGEFKVGDIVRVTDEKGGSNPNGYIGTVTKFDPNLRNTSETKENRLAEVDTGRGISMHAIVELIVPVEKRFDAKG
ncbi:hypothetical protein L4A40_26965 [Bacillus cereus]|uniref:hypothetical protein n=1 Tax=Bacillus cereus TaxID=1396 RepID=UPI001F0F83D5|nr:hypothetical protein [Bacillus cereus]MCH5476729.1 hypothetical protein [Bacillus cereus]